jgi:hypothetical protein
MPMNYFQLIGAQGEPYGGVGNDPVKGALVHHKTGDG